MDRASRREDIVTMVLATWTTIGVFVDAYQHSTDPGLETFWTPWHALFYSGFLATAAWLVHLAFKRLDGSRSLFEAAPLAHRAALYGIVVFAVGGIGDAVWHSVFGVETSLDALLSPTHLMLWLGLLTISSTPLRAAWTDRTRDDATTMRSFGPVLTSAVLTLSGIAFFFEYLWMPVDAFRPRIRYVAGVTGEFDAAFGVAGIVISTAVMMAAVLLLSRRWTTPFGTVTVLLTVTNVLMAIGFDNDLEALPAVLIAGLVGDVLLRVDASRQLLAAGIPLVLWSLYFVQVGRLDAGLGWPPEIWGGAIFFAVLVGLALEAGFEQAVRLERDRVATPA